MEGRLWAQVAPQVSAITPTSAAVTAHMCAMVTLLLHMNSAMAKANAFSLLRLNVRLTMHIPFPSPTDPGEKRSF